jgi:hypothetical protein
MKKITILAIAVSLLGAVSINAHNNSANFGIEKNSQDDTKNKKACCKKEKSKCCAKGEEAEKQKCAKDNKDKKGDCCKKPKAKCDAPKDSTATPKK